MPTTPRVVVRVASRRRRRSLAVGLIAFGLLGLGLIVPSFLILAGLSSGDGQPDTRAELLATLDAARESLLDAELAARDTERGLVSGGSAAGSAGEFMGDMASTLRTLSATLRIEIPLIGGAPFAAVGDEFGALADRASGLATDLDTVRTSLDVSSRDLVRLADGLRDLQTQTALVREAVSDATGVEGLGLARLLGMALLGWLAIPAGLSLGMGVRLLRTTRAPRPRGLDAQT